MDQKKQYIFITGASSGLGRVIAVNLSANYNLVLHGRDESRLAQTAMLCNKNCSQLIFIADFASLSDIEQSLTTFLLANNAEINGFVHSAGYMKMLPVKVLSLTEMEKMFAANVFSAALITKVLMSKKTNGAALRNIVFISSNVSNFGAKAFSIYGATKGALDSLMRCLAVELAPRVRVNSVLPGAVKTEMTDGIFADDEIAGRMEKEYPLGIGSPEDIADMVRFLLSENAKWITGQQLTVDGGRTINISG